MSHGIRVARQMLSSFCHVRRTQRSVALVTSRPARAAVSELLDKIDLHIEPGVFANQAKDGNWTCLHGDKECHLDRFEVPVPTLACCAYTPLPIRTASEAAAQHKALQNPALPGIARPPLSHPAAAAACGAVCDARSTPNHSVAPHVCTDPRRHGSRLCSCACCTRTPS
jgi:hypothetical protein